MKPEYTTTDRDRCVAHVMALFEEVPHLHVTKPQIKRLCALDDLLTDRLLESLFASGYLVETKNHQICRAVREPVHH